MPAACQQIDWSGLKVAAIALGNVREAAVRASINLPPDEQRRFIERVNKRSQREQWMNKSKALKASSLSPNAKPLSNSVQNGSDSLANALADDSRATKIGFSKAARKVAECLPKKSEGQLLDKDTAQAAKHWAGVAAQAQPGWEQEKKRDDGLVSVTLIRLELPGSVHEKTVHAKVLENTTIGP